MSNPVNQSTPKEFFREEYAEFVNKYGKKSIYKYRCNLCDVRLLYPKNMGKHLRKYHSDDVFGGSQLAMDGINPDPRV